MAMSSLWPVPMAISARFPRNDAQQFIPVERQAAVLLTVCGVRALAEMIGRCILRESRCMNFSTITKYLTDASDSRTFLDGSVRRSAKLRSAVIGYGVYQPGWKWSLHAGRQTGRTSENHIGVILSGSMTIRDAEGIEWNIGPGDAFEVGPGHDAWVVGNQPCIAVDFCHCL